MARVAGIYWDDTAAAPGISLSIYFSGCHFHCPGCHNPEAQDFNYGEEFTWEHIQTIIEKLNKNGVQRSLSILGGEPFENVNLAAVAALVAWCKNKYPDLVIYIWTGYTIEELQERPEWEIIHEILTHCKCLIDGRFDITKRDTTLPLRGSSNQRIIYMEDFLS